MMIAPKNPNRFLAGFFVTYVALALLLPPFPQDPKYHAFAADRALAGIPNFWNVISNFPFLVVAIMGWANSNRCRGNIAEVFRVGVFLTGIGSAYYHWSPSTERLFWDRLPMTIGFSGVVAALVSERVDANWGRRLVWPLIIFNAATVVYWRWTEAHGRGNLSPYGVVQFGTILLTLAVILLFPRKGAEQKHLWLAVAAYGAAKLFEAFDQQIGAAIQVMGGHPVKHVAAAAGCHFLQRALFAKSH